MPRVLFVSKPIAPPFHDGTKCLVRDVASNLRELEPVVMTTPAGLALLPAGVSGRAVYAGSGAFAPALLENARAALSLALGPRDDLWHFVFAPNPRTGAVARAMQKLRRIPIVQTVASPPRSFSGLSRLIFGDALVTQSRATRASLEQAAAAEGFALPEIDVIPPPVPELRAPSAEQIEAARSEFGLARGQKLVLYPGDLEVSSGAEATAELALPLTERFADVVVGFAYRNKTPRAAECASRLRERLAGKRVLFSDRVSSMHALLAAAELVIFPVDDVWGKVDQPIVLLEALALGTPAIVLAHGPLKDVEGALLLPTLETKSWLEAASALLENTERRAALIEEGRARVRAVYAAGVVARAYEAIYLRTLKRPASVTATASRSSHGRPL